MELFKIVGSNSDSAGVLCDVYEAYARPDEGPGSLFRPDSSTRMQVQRLALLGPSGLNWNYPFAV